MPLHVDIRLNTRLLHTIHIGRVDGGERPDDLNVYRAVVTEPGELNYDFYAPYSVEFTHRYGDGADVCIARAIQALTPNLDVASFTADDVRGDLGGENHRIQSWFRYSDTPLGPTTPWGLQPFGYHYTGGPIGSTNWVLPSPTPMYVNIFMEDPYLLEDKAHPYPGRITVIADTDNHFNDWTSITSGLTVPVEGKTLGHTRGYALWSVWFINREEFIAALRQADDIMRDPDIWLAQAALTPPVERTGEDD